MYDKKQFSLFFVLEMIGVEPMTSCLQSTYSTETELHSLIILQLLNVVNKTILPF